MKKIKNHNKAIILSVAIALIITLTACSNGDSSPNSTFPNIDDAKIPDVLELTVGTLGDCYFSDGITDNPDYKSVLITSFNDTTENDYDTLMEHYQSTSTGTDENGFMVFDWGTLLVTTKDSSISITALIK